jgi:hypothetical protein
MRAGLFMLHQGGPGERDVQAVATLPMTYALLTTVT